MAQIWDIKRSDSHACILSMKWNTYQDNQRVLLLADCHWDSAQCDRKALARDLDKALEINAPVLIFGDFFDAMQGKWDPRSSQSSLRHEHRGGSYLDLLVDTSFDWLKKYASVLSLISPGNHETSIQKRHEVNLSERLVTLLRHQKSPCVLGTYWGFVGFRHVISKEKSLVTSLHYHHGYGGGGEVTRGLIDHSRTRSMFAADVFVSGHIHRRNYDENVITVMTPTGLVQQRKQLFLRCSTYKNETDGWHAEKGRAARPIGGWWLEFNGRRERNWLVTPSASATA